MKEEDYAELARAGMNKFMQRRKLKKAPWTRDANISRTSLVNFLSRTSHDMNLTAIMALARAAGATLDEVVYGTVPAENLRPITPEETKLVREVIEAIRDRQPDATESEAERPLRRRA